VGQIKGRGPPSRQVGELLSQAVSCLVPDQLAGRRVRQGQVFGHHQDRAAAACRARVKCGQHPLVAVRGSHQQAILDVTDRPDRQRRHQGTGFLREPGDIENSDKSPGHRMGDGVSEAREVPQRLQVVLLAGDGEGALVVGSAPIPQEPHLTGTLTNISSLLVDVEATCLRRKGITYDITTDAPATVRFSDGRILDLGDAGRRAGTLR
jgi:hypothetical protein